LISKIILFIKGVREIMKKSVLLIIIYIFVISLPLIIAVIVNPVSTQNLLYEIGKNFALIGIMIITFQILLAGRFKWIEKPFGFDILIRYHKHMAILGAMFLILHPVFLIWGGSGLDLITSFNTVWYIWAGRIAITLLITNEILSLFQSKLHIKFENWRIIHDILAPVIIIFGFIHSWEIGSDIKNIPMRILWIIIPSISIVLFLFHRFLRPFFLSRNPYKVIDVKKETERVWTVKLAPPEGEEIFSYLPGQFQFITFKRRKDLPVEEHHWTISSSPTEKKYVSSTIKELGDFTSTISETEIGDTAIIHAPFGRFSHLLHPDEEALVFIAGGIGITPMISMLRYMRDTNSTISVVLLYGNRNENEIAFRKELKEIEEGEHPALKVIHVLSNPGESWTGVRGYIDREKIEKFCGDLKNKGFYISGPKGLIEATIKNFKALEVDDNKVHLEIFSLLD
jgi:predicted ferric reductase